MVTERKIVSLETNLPPVISPVEHLSLKRVSQEVEVLNRQLRFLHNLPKVNDIKPTEYMHETFELLRRRLIDIHDRACMLLDKEAKAKRKRS